jgi:predicted glycosyltransferase
MHSHWLLYSYDALGLGHARRMTGIARAVLPSRPDLSALLVTCSPQIDALPVPAGSTM